VLVDRYGSQRVGMLGLILLALAVASVMMVPNLLAGAAYAAALGAGLGVCMLCRVPAWPSISARVISAT
jgi:hypothetical protein